MCGRFTLSAKLEEVQGFLNDYYSIEDFELDYRPRYNVSPGQEVLSVLYDGKKYRVGTLKWGFVPFWANDEKIGYKMINARAETLADKPAFKHSLLNKRCVILADSFYEWKKVENNKIPMRIKLKSNEIFPLAGLWSSYNRSDGSKLYTCTIITTSPNEFIGTIHDRMPVILDKDTQNIWLNPQINDANILNPILKSYPASLMDAYQVSSLVNNSKVDNFECIQPLA